LWGDEETTMADSPVLTREQEELLAMLVKARREAGPE
jgi:hypothetical protein